MKKNYLFSLLFLSILYTANINAQTPTWLWACTSANDTNAVTNDIATDNDGNIFACGDFDNATITFGSQTLDNLATQGGSNGYINKYSANGTLLWAKGASSTTSVIFGALDTDDSGNVYTTGSFMHNMTIDGTTISAAYTAGFIAKFNSAGTLLWLKQIGLEDTSASGGDITVNNSSLYILGTFQGNFSTQTSILQSTGYRDIYIAKYNLDGDLSWVTNIGGTDDDYASKLAIGPDNTIHVSGTYESPTISLGTSQITSQGSEDALLAKFSDDGEPIWIVSQGTLQMETAGTIAVDGNNNIYAAYGYKTDDFMLGTTLLPEYGAGDIAIAKHDPDGNVLWATTAASDAGDAIADIITDQANNVYITGFTYDDQYYFAGTIQTMNGSCDLFVSKLTPAGNVIWFKHIQQSSIVHSRSMILDNNNNLIVGGRTQSIMLDDIFLNKTFMNMFVAKMDQEELSVSDFVNTKTNIYPNPAYDILNISDDITGKDYFIVDTMGRTVTKGTITGKSINIATLSTGMYILNIDNTTTKFIKE